jgi:hypothetical protein
MTETITFNVGGHKYEVSKNLFELNHPNSMLAKSASDQWHEDPETEIFIERDGALFAFVLSYIRDQKVNLPLTVSKKALLDELAYYGIDVGNVEDIGVGNVEDIDDGKARGVLAANSLISLVQLMKSVAEEYEQKSESLATESVCASVAAYLIRKYLQYPTTSFTRRINFDNFPRYNELVKVPLDKRLELCNLHLNKAGLNLEIVLSNYLEYYKVDVIRTE